MKEQTLKEQKEDNKAWSIAHKIAMQYKNILSIDDLDDLESDIAFALIDLAYKR